MPPRSADQGCGDIHALDPAEVLEAVHSFEFWFEAVEGYLSGLTHGHRPETAETPLSEIERDRLVTVLCNYCVGETAALEGAQDADAITKEVLQGVIKDERRHVGFGENELGRRLAGAPHIRARIGQVKKELDHLVLDTLEETMKHIGIDRAEQDRLGWAYLESVDRLGFT